MSPGSQPGLLLWGWVLQMQMGVMDRVKNWLDWGKRIQFLIAVLGSLWTFCVGATAKAYLKDFTHLSIEWQLPLYSFAAFVGLLLFVVVSNFWLTRNKRMPDSEASEIIHDVKVRGSQCRMFYFFEARALELEAHVVQLWHHWNNEGEKLIHPLDARIDNFQTHSIEVRMKLMTEQTEFLVLYSHHINILKVEFPEFTSPVIATGFPSDREYHQVVANLRTRAEMLKEEAEKAWNKY